VELGGRRRLRKTGGEEPPEAEDADESLLAQILAEVTDGVLAFDHDFHFTYLNSAAEKVLGRAAEELIGSELWAELPSLLETPFWAACQRSMGERVAVTVEGFLPALDSWFEARAFPTKTGLIVVLRDVSERVHARRANERLMLELSFERARFEAILRQMPSGALLADGEGRLLMANKQFERVFGGGMYDAEDIEGYGAYEGYFPDGSRVEPEQWPLARSLVTGEPSESQIELVRRDGVRITTRCRAGAIRDELGNIVAGLVIVDDVTEQVAVMRRLHELAARLEESERSYRFLADSMPQVAWTTLPDGQIEYLNAVAKRYLSVTEPEKLNIAIASMVHPEDRELTRERWAWAKRKGEIYQVEHRLRGPDGAYHWFLTRGLPFRDADGSVLRWFGTSTEIDELKRLERERAHAVEVLEHGDPCVVVDRNLRVTLVNQNSERLSGVPRARLLGRRLSETFPEVDSDSLRYKRELERAARDRQVVAFEERWERSQGWLSVVAYPMQDGGVAIFSRDITQQKNTEARLEQALRERDRSLALLDTFLASAPVGFAVLDRELRYLRVNQTLAEFNGVPVAAHVGRKVREVLPTLPEFVERYLERVFATGEPIVSVEAEPFASAPWLPSRTLLGSYYPLRDADGEIYAIGAVLVDVSEQRRAADEVRASAELQELLVGVLAHDLRNPLNAITLTTESLLRKAGLPETVSGALARLSKSARRMATLIAQLLDFTRVRSSGGMPIEKRPVELAEICRGVLEEISAAHPARCFEFSTSEDTTGVWDPDRLAQAVSNLVSNAVSYGRAESPIVVKVADEGPRVSFSINNQGDPIPAEKMGHLFDPFNRGESASRRRSDGLGLGLYITDQIVRAHRGRLTVKSDAVHGTTFVITLPRLPPPRAAT
jgi:PAS domain S-box-containing protein